MSTLHAALNYLSVGYSVIPCRPNEKVALVRWEEFQKTRATEGQVEAWWLQWPDANLAIITGAISGLTVIDVDGEQGLASFQAIPEVAKLQGTRVIKTPKGHHLYFKYNPAFHTGAGFMPGLDVRNDGGYVIAPNSSVGGKFYTVLRDRDPIELSVVPEAFQLTTRTSAKELDSAEQPDWVSAALEHGAPLSKRNSTAAKLAGYFHSKSLPPDIILQLMGPFAQKCTPPMDVHELQRTIQSVSRYQQRTRELRITDAPVFHRDVEDMVFTWEQHGVSLRLGEIGNGRWGAECEISVEAQAPGEPIVSYGPASYHLTSVSAREGLLKALRGRLELDWASLLDTASRLALSEHRGSSNVVDLMEYTVRKRSRWAINGLLVYGQITVLVAEGGVGKSLFAEACMLALQLNEPRILGLHPTDALRGLYLDWESTEEEHGERLGMMLTGAQLGYPSQPFLYLRCSGKLLDIAKRLRSVIEANAVRFLVIDSAGLACGNKPTDEEMTNGLFNAVRSLGPDLTTLIVHHVNKGGGYFGSVYWWNMARNLWEMRKVQQPGEKTFRLGLYNRKINSGAKCPPLGYNVEFSEDSVQFRREDIATSTELASGASPKDHLRALLIEQGPTTTEVLAEAMNTTTGAIRTLLSRHPELLQRLATGEIALREAASSLP